MKILLVSQYYYPERVSVSEIAENLVKLGNDVTVLTSKPNYGFNEILSEYKQKDYEVLNGVKINRLTIYPRKTSRLSICRNYLSYYFKASKFAKHINEKFDVVLSVSLSPVISINPAIVYAKKNNVKHVLYCEDLWPESTVVTGAVKKGSLIYKLLFKWSKKLYSKCDKIVVSSPSFKNYFADVLGIEDKGFEHAFQSSISPKSVLQKHTYSNEHPFVYAGNIGKIQLVNELVLAFTKIKSNAHLYLMGMGRELNNIKKLIAENEIKNVEYVGALPIEKAEQYFWNAEALIASLKSDGYVGKTIPNKVLQYHKYKRPILGIVSGDSLNILKATGGSFISGETSDEIAKSIDQICAMDEQTKNKMGELNLKYYEENLTNYKLVSELFELIKDFIK